MAREPDTQLECPTCTERGGKSTTTTHSVYSYPDGWADLNRLRQLKTAGSGCSLARRAAETRRTLDQPRSAPTSRSGTRTTSPAQPSSSPEVLPAPRDP